MKNGAVFDPLCIAVSSIYHESHRGELFWNRAFFKRTLTTFGFDFQRIWCRSELSSLVLCCHCDLIVRVWVQMADCYWRTAGFWKRMPLSLRGLAKFYQIYDDFGGIGTSWRCNWYRYTPSANLSGLRNVGLSTIGKSYNIRTVIIKIMPKNRKLREKCVASWSHHVLIHKHTQ